MKPPTGLDLSAIVKSVNFVDLVGQVWRAIQAGESSKLPLSVMADALLDAGHLDAGCALYGVIESGRHSLELKNLDTVGLAPLTGEKKPGRQLRFTIVMRPAIHDEDDGELPPRKCR